ncbi:hypothetical protein [Alishewanella phage vB_AspM_Slickus01]|nr:hypothetical protein [Alishewanella phage vB_AspM_Slicko01]WGH49878.1 hypothetical protein [Alishewanella phage vB_AspM_Slickus01]
MAFEVMSGLYRTAEGNGTYKSVVCITFTNKEAWIHGLGNTIPLSCVKEIIDFICTTDCRTIKYLRKKNGETVLKVVNINTDEYGNIKLSLSSE